MFALQGLVEGHGWTVVLAALLVAFTCLLVRVSIAIGHVFNTLSRILRVFL